MYSIIVLTGVTLALRLHTIGTNQLIYRVLRKNRVIFSIHCKVSFPPVIAGNLQSNSNTLYRPEHNFRPKMYHFLFLLPFDAEALKTCKNTTKLLNLCALPCLGLGLWLTLTVYFDLA